MSARNGRRRGGGARQVLRQSWCNPECGRPCDCHIEYPNQTYDAIMLTIPFVEAIGALGAVLTTLGWLPQALKVVREKETRSLSLPATAAFTLGVVFWLIYGLAIRDWPLIGSNTVTLLPLAVILATKLRYG
jgi:MtN3 and saliva related transmembrane protein